tara:strand:- start:3376 stop:4299 length:924 start_codon:yes stop_codon:yes gene_type:complete
MANGYSQSPAQGRVVTNTNGSEEESYRFGTVTFLDGTTGTQPPPDSVEEPYVEPVEPDPYPILGGIKFQKTIYSQTAFRKKVDTSINELTSKKEEVDVDKFFDQYFQIFFDIPQRGINSHETLFKESKEYLLDYRDPKEDQISDLEQQIEALELQILELQQGYFDPETGEPSDDSIGALLEQGELQARREAFIGDINNPYLYWEPPDEYGDLGLGVGLENHRKYLDEDSYPSGPPGITLASTNSNQMVKDFNQTYEDERDMQNRRTYQEWRTDAEKRSSGNRTTALHQLLEYHKNYQMNKFQSANEG